MNSINDLKFLSKIKLYTDRTLTLKSLAVLGSQKISSVSELASALTEFHIIECVQRRLRLDNLPQQDVIYERLLLCWISDLRHDIEIIQPSESLVKVFNAFMNKYTINALFYSLLNKGMEITNYPVMSSIAEAVRKAKNTNDLLGNLSSLKREDTEVLKEVMQKYLGTPLSELNPYKLYSEAIHQYFQLLEKVTGPNDPKITACLSHMKLINELSSAVRRKASAEVLSKLLNRLPLKEGTAIRDNLEDHFRLELLLESSLMNYCSNVLSTQIFSKGTLLRYLIWKDWETKVITFLLSSLKLGYGGTYLRDVIDILVRTYDVLTK